MLFHLELGFFGQRFRLWIGLPFVLKGSRQTDNCTCCSLSIICRDCNLLVCIRGFRNLTGKMNLQLIGFYLERCPSTIVCVRTARNRIEHIEILASITIYPSLPFALKHSLGIQPTVPPSYSTLSGVRISYVQSIGPPGKISSLLQAVKSKQTSVINGISNLFIFVIIPMALLGY